MQTLEYLLKLRHLLQETLASSDRVDQQKALDEVEARLEASCDPSSEYAAMARALLKR